MDPCEEIEDFDGDSEEPENDEDYTEMDEAKDALITESENLELGRLKEEQLLVWNRLTENNFVLVVFFI